jgi:hypothetical protein
MYLPNILTPWRTEALEQRKRDIQFLSRLVREVKEKMEQGRAPISFCRELLEIQAETGMSELEIAYTCGKCDACPFIYLT